jgi:PTS system nitrogen regulatory IIA component
MKVSPFLKTELILSDLQALTKEEVIQEFAQAIPPHYPGITSEELFRVLMDRERLGSTGIGEGFAIPHGKLRQLHQIIIAFGRSKAGIPFDSMDGKPAHYFFVLLAPEDSAGEHLKALAKISRFLKNSDFRESLVRAVTREELERSIREQDELNSGKRE